MCMCRKLTQKVVQLSFNLPSGLERFCFDRSIANKSIANVSLLAPIVSPIIGNHLKMQSVTKRDALSVFKGTGHDFSLVRKTN